MQNIPKEITKEFIEKLYVQEGKSCLTIGKMIGKNAKAVSRYLKKFGIKSRPFSTKGLQTRLGAVLSEEIRDKIRQSHLKNGTQKHKHKGYIMVYKPNHPYAQKNYVPEHRLIVEQEIGRYLESYEIIHHIDEDKTNNNLNNLQITTRAEHMTIHKKLKIIS